MKWVGFQKHLREGEGTGWRGVVKGQEKKIRAPRENWRQDQCKK